MRCVAKVSSALTTLLIAAAATRTAHAQDAITRHSVDCGGAIFVTAGGYKLGATIGQPDAGTLTGGAFTLRGGFWFGGQAPVTGVGEDVVPVLAFRFLRSSNPVRVRSRIAFQLPSAERVRLSFFDVAGRAAKRLDFGLVAAGRQERGWKAEDDAGQPLSSGVYYLRLEAGREQATQKVLILR